MSQIVSITTKADILRQRAAIIATVRAFFAQQELLEITAPSVVAYPGQEPNLEALKVSVFDETKKHYHAYLHTSPEYTLKKCLAAGLGDVYSLGPAFRNIESFGGLHNPEFTMLEWYRIGSDMTHLMDDLDALFVAVSTVIPHTLFSTPTERLHMREVWQQFAKVDLDAYLTQAAMYQLVREKGYMANASDSYEELFYTIFLNEIEPHLGMKSPVILHHYPAQMAALSKLSESDLRYAERFELYVQGVELANAFTELTDANEQRKRLQAEQRERQRRGMSVYQLDEDFLDAVAQLPDCAGIAFGVDRFIQLLLGCQNIDDVLVLPASRLFKSQDHEIT